MSHRQSKKIRKFLKSEGIDVNSWDGRDIYRQLKRESKQQKKAVLYVPQSN